MSRFPSRLLFRGTVVALLALGALASCAESGGSSHARHATASKDDDSAGGGSGRVGHPLPALVLRSVKNGQPIDLDAMKGKVVLLDIWASWCGPCREEMPLLDEMAARLKGKGVEFVAVSIDEDKSAAQEFLRARPKWTLIVAHDPKGKVPEVLQPPKMPTSYIIDGRGVLRYVNAGFERADAQKIEHRLLALAAESS
jgi:thiol-disulfide isomerase/thioredoxin